MEATQILSDSALDDSEILERENDKDNHVKKLIGVLLFDDKKEWDIFQGDTISIGRDPENCQVTIDNKVCFLII